MRYIFNHYYQLEILNALVFDASFDFEDLIKQLNSNQLVLPIERRVFERVTRYRFFFSDRTRFEGASSSLIINNIASISLDNVQEDFKDNHFISDTTYTNNILSITTSWGLKVNITTDDLHIELNDIKQGYFGQGKLKGNVGYTKEEWFNFLDKQNYDYKSLELSSMEKLRQTLRNKASQLAEKHFKKEISFDQLTSEYPDEEDGVFDNDIDELFYLIEHLPLEGQYHYDRDMKEINELIVKLRS